MAISLHRKSGLEDHRADGGDPDDSEVCCAIVDREAFAELYLRYVDSIYRFCFRRLGSREEAEDATSLIFSKALAAMPRYREDGPSFRSWLFAIARNVVADEWRARRRHSIISDDLHFSDPSPSPEDIALANEEQGSVRSLLNGLSRDQADIVELRLAGLGGSEIARVLGKSPNTVKVTQHRAYSRLRALLSGKEAEGAS